MTHEKCNATMTVKMLHECTREAGHPLTSSVWGDEAQTHECCGYMWLDTAPNATPHVSGDPS